MESFMRAGRAMRLTRLLVVAAAVACGESSTTTTDIAWSDYEGPGVGVKIELDGVVVEMDPSVHYESHYYSQTGKPSVRTQTMNGMPFELDTSSFTIGDHSFDGLESGDRVLITADGILVNGEKRWEFPGS